MSFSLHPDIGDRDKNDPKEERAKWMEGRAPFFMFPLTQRTPFFL
ncbi:hypothetical protein [Allomuricauda sp. SCSIO 64092]|nr:hypothetical protein [Muricauda sp. SCSIO 64092]